jgi:L-alanine-DL-glutamate epimerase-like enolase superfamily enzyme
MLEPLVVGRCADEPASTWHVMVDALRNAPRAGLSSMALSAVDCALWDVAARLHEIPLAKLLGQVHDRLPVYGSGGFTTYDKGQLDEQLGGWLDQDVTAVKIKIAEDRGHREERDLARTRQAREAIGPGVELFVDANGGYSVKQAVRVMRRSADLDVRWFEEPVSSDDLTGLAQVRDAVDAEVAAGEYGDSLDYFARMCAAEAVDCLQVDLTRCGGITEWRRIAAVAAAHHLDVSCHCAPALHVSAAAATDRLRHLEWFHDHVRIESMLFDGVPTIQGGALAVPAEPGNGLRLRHAAAAEHQVR